MSCTLTTWTTYNMTWIKQIWHDTAGTMTLSKQCLQQYTSEVSDSVKNSPNWWLVVGNGYLDPVSKFLTGSKSGNYYPVFHHDVQNTTNFVLYLHLFTTLKSIVALMYFRLHSHKLHRLITRRALVSETTNIISCDAMTPPPPSCGFRYLPLLSLLT